jgi:hypothetical protein
MYCSFISKNIFNLQSAEIHLALSRAKMAKKQWLALTIFGLALSTAEKWSALTRQPNIKNKIFFHNIIICITNIIFVINVMLFLNFYVEKNPK